MIVRKGHDGQVLLIGQTDHSRLAGQFAAHWGNAQFAVPQPYESIARAAAFHDFGYLRYETSPNFNQKTGETPNFRDVQTDAKRLEEYQWCSDWLFGTDLYAATMVNMHRTGLWRGRYGAMHHPEHKIRPQTQEVDAFVEGNEEARAKMIAQHGWDPAELRINYRLLQTWDLLSLYFSCQEPYEDYIEPVPTSYGDRDGEGVRITLAPLGGNRIAVDSFPFDVDPCRFQLAARRLPQAKFADQAAFRKAYFQAPIELIEYELVSAARIASTPKLQPPGLIGAIIAVESGGDTHATSASGAMGLMQLKRATAARYGVIDLYNPAANIAAGARYLHDLLSRFHGGVTLAIAAYKMGPCKGISRPFRSVSRRPSHP